jgi:hypothetical protein
MFHNFFDISSKREDVYFHILYILKRTRKKKIITNSLFLIILTRNLKITYTLHFLQLKFGTLVVLHIHIYYQNIFLFVQENQLTNYSNE